MSLSRLGAAALMGTASATVLAQPTSNVTLYGIVDAAIVRSDPASGAGTTELFSGLQSGSRWGFRGREQISPGLSAEMQLEGGFSTDTGQAAQGGRLFGRLAWVGMSGGFGQARAASRGGAPAHNERARRAVNHVSRKAALRHGASAFI